MTARDKIAAMFPSRSLGESVADEILAEHRAEVLREAADRLEGIAGQAEAKVAEYYGTASGIGPGSCDMVREAARDLRDLAAAVPGPRGDAEPWRPIRFCGRPATHPAHLYLHAREAVRCMGSAYLGPAQPAADTSQPERVTVVCPHQTPAWTCRSFPECPCGDTPDQPPADTTGGGQSEAP